MIKKEIVEKINRKIKNRDFWMPFTSSMLEEDAKQFLDNPKNFSFPYMSMACETNEYGRGSLQGILHPYDYTARPQIVTAASHESYYKLICAFKKITEVGALLNTSLNIHGYPIVRTPKEAYKVLENTDLDGLIFENCLMLRKEFA